MSAASVPKLFYHNSRLMRTIFRQLHRQQKDNTFCDVILQVEGMQIPAHSCILSACSPFFTERLSLMKPVAQQFVELSGMKVSALSRLVQYIYTAELEVTRDEVEEVLAAARQLRILELEALCLEGGKLVKADLGRRLNRDCFQSQTYFSRSGIGISPVVLPTVAADSQFRKRVHDATVGSRAGPCNEVAATASEICFKPQEAPAIKEKVGLSWKDFDCIKQNIAVAESDTGKCLSHKLSRVVFKRDSDEQNESNTDPSVTKSCHTKATMLGNSLSKASNVVDIGGLQLGKVNNKCLKCQVHDATVTGISEHSFVAVLEGSESMSEYAREQSTPLQEVAKVCLQCKSEPDLNRLSYAELAPSSDYNSLALPKPEVSSDSDPASLVLPEMGDPFDHTNLALSVPETSDLTSCNAAVIFPIHFTNLCYKTSHSELSPTTQRKTFIKNPCIARKQSTSSDTSGDESPVGRMKLRKRINSACWEVVHEIEPEEQNQSQNGTCLPILVREVDTAVGQFLEVNPASSNSKTSFVSATETTSETLHRLSVKPEEQSHVEFAVQSLDQVCQTGYSIGSAQEIKELLDIVLSTSDASEFDCATPDLEECIMTKSAAAEFVNEEEGKESIPSNQQVAAANHFSSSDEGGEGSIPADQQDMALEHEKYTDQMQCLGAESAPVVPRSPSHGSTNNLAGKLDVLMSSQRKPTGARTSKKQQAQTTTTSSGDCSDGYSSGLMPKVAVCHRHSLRQMRKKKMQAPDGSVVPPVKCTEASLVTHNRSGSDQCIMPKRRWQSRTLRCVEPVESGKGSLLSPKTSRLRKTVDYPSPGKQPQTSDSSPEITQILLDSEEEIDIVGSSPPITPIIPCGIKPEPASESDTETIIVD
uniref:BTB/POZ domain-containing protein 18 n=1 Tax=Geotrypetes seraphini TaxID=260995 RepID=A0A6P8NI45_GEOSA|nr:BTB/POZ domain-containing protein 18 [Geotrypetes seraphini]XP_033775599.1 BTB/POZ domain-containing protein 18 [Geotrypetes seraphini]XP_033775600.1 BTB/POZ domain-containing protein 18 [Geotrypetes seraphini]XP_033775601.1 BTB/POZ domain-containing protein 18 [Geotrypetes seraphini]XP_033775602.1 BTB/POZ domain-containing protein 18 [Geotrypetes seraphini]